MLGESREDPGIEWYRKIVLRHGWWLLGALAVLAAWSVSRLWGLRVEAGADTLLDENDPALEIYNETREAWGTDEYAIVCVTADDWFTPDGVKRLQAIAADLGALPHVASLLSVLDVPLMRQHPERKPNLFTLGSSIRDLGDAGIELERARSELLEHELAAGNLVSRDGRSLSVLVNLDADAPASEVERRRLEMVEGVRKVARTWSAKLPEPVRLSGVPIINVNLIEHVWHDLRFFGLAALVLFTLALAVVYRSPLLVLGLLLAAALPVVLVVGFMAAWGLELSVITANLPLLLFVLTLPYGIYVVERWREQGGSASSRKESEDRVLAAVRGAGIPCLFSCLTTLAGFAALTTSGVVPVKTFGKMMAAGMGAGLLIVFLFLPAYLICVRWRAASKAAAPGGATEPRGPVGLCAAAASARPGWVVIASAILLVAGVAGALRLSAENKFTNYFRKGSEVYQGLEFIDQKMGGTVSLEICLRSKEDGFFRSEAGLAAVEAVERYFDGVPETGNIRSVHAVYREMRKTFTAEAFPGMQSGALIAMVDVAAPDMLRDVAEQDYRTSRIFVRLEETAPTLNRVRILEGLRAHLEAQPELEGLEVETTGIFVLYANMLQSLLTSQRNTILVVVAAVYVMLLILFRSPWFALLVLVPQTLPALVVLGIMGWARIPLDLVTVMTGAIAMGVGIDAAIQYASRYRAELAIDGDRRAALRRSHATIGRAIWIATSVIVAGFAVLVISDFFPSVWFGLLTGVAMLMSQFAALTTLPAVFLCAGVPRVPVAKAA